MSKKDIVASTPIAAVRALSQVPAGVGTYLSVTVTLLGAIAAAYGAVVEGNADALVSPTLVIVGALGTLGARAVQAIAFARIAARWAKPVVDALAQED
jgi:hypothetical protein